MSHEDEDSFDLVIWQDGHLGSFAPGQARLEGIVGACLVPSMPGVIKVNELRQPMRRLRVRSRLAVLVYAPSHRLRPRTRRGAPTNTFSTRVKISSANM
jgi:hypothetical protein